MKLKHCILSLLALPLLFSCRGKAESAQEAVETESVIPPLGFRTELYEADTLQIRSGETFSNLFNRLGMSAAGAYELSRICNDSIFDVRKMRAGNRIHAYYSPLDSARGPLAYAVYEQDAVRSIVFSCGDSLAVWAVDKPVEHQRLRADLTINSSLWNDMKAAGASPSLIMNLADIYQWSVNFFTLQKGDKFNIIYTQSVCEGEVIAIDTVHFSLFTPTEGKQVAAVLYDSGLGGRTYWDKGGESLKRMFLKAPLKYNRISSKFSYSRKHPVTGKVKAHTAVDYAAPTGTPVHAIGDGTVSACGWDPTGGGNRIRIKHMRGYESCYMHLSRFAPGIRTGSRVNQGQLIGYVGATGTATGPHLDFRIWENGRPIDPLKLNSPASEPLAKEHLEAFTAVYDAYMKEINGD